MSVPHGPLEGKRPDLKASPLPPAPCVSAWRLGGLGAWNDSYETRMTIYQVLIRTFEMDYKIPARFVEETYKLLWS